MVIIATISLFSSFPKGFLTSRFVSIYDRNVIGFDTCEHSTYVHDLECSLSINNYEIKRLCSGLICVSKFVYDDYSGPPDLLLGRRYFYGAILDRIDLLNNSIKRIITINITTRNNDVLILSVEKDLGNFTYKEFCIGDYYEGIIKPAVKYLSNNVIKLNVAVLNYEVLDCNPYGCLYHYTHSSNESSLDIYEKAFSFWTSTIKYVLGYNSTLKFIDNVYEGFTIFLPHDEYGTIRFDEFHILWDFLSRSVDSDLVIIVELPRPVKLRDSTLLAFTYGNFIFLSTRRVDVIVHEVGHVLGLQHPRISEVKDLWVSDIFHESVMLRTTLSRYKRISLGDLVGLARSIYMLEDFNTQRRLINYLSSLGIDVENLCIIVPVVRRVYPSTDIPEVISSFIKEGLAKFEVDDGNITNLEINQYVVDIIRFISKRYVVID
ncbi:MAG: hypothetical protein QXK56_00295 [Sulfolobales archaeon]